MHFADLVNRHDFIDVIARHADRNRFDMSVCTLGIPSNIADPDYGAAGIRNWNLHAPARKHYPRAIVALAAVLRREAIDVVHAHHYEPTVVAAAATILHPRTVLVIGRHYSDAIYLNTDGAKREAMLAVEAACNRRAGRIVAPSTMIADLLCRRPGVPREKVVVIPYGFEDEKFAVSRDDVRNVREELTLDGRTTIGTFGRLYRDKGQTYLLEAMPELIRAFPDVLLLLVGEGAERPLLERLVTELGLRDHVRFLGWRRDALVVMSAVDIVAQPTLQEAFSQSMIEALWLGKPLLMTDVSGAADVIADQVNALLVPPGQTQALTTALMSLLGDEALRARLGDAARRDVRTELAIDRIVPRFEALYGSVACRP